MKVKNIMNIKHTVINLTNSLDCTNITLLKNELQKHYACFWEQSILMDNNSESANGRKLRVSWYIYRTFKNNFGREFYLDVVRNPN